MTLSSVVAPHLPYLRRYARALTGWQNSGDAYVAALMETLIADPSLLKAKESPKISLFHALSRLWGAIDINKRSDAFRPGWEETVQDRLAAIPGTPRQAFLLMAVEDFSLDDTAVILGVSSQQASAYYDEANRQISQMIASDILIIEDEPLIAMDLEEIVTSLGHNLVGVARTRDEAVSIVARRKPQLVLSDIQLADGSSGIDAVNDILRDQDVPVIFITAFPERLLTGMKAEPTFLITKPFSPEMVKALIAQALFFDMKAAGKA